MKRHYQSSSNSSSPLSNSCVADDSEPTPKRPRIIVSSPILLPDDVNEIEQHEDDITIDEPIVSIMNYIVNSHYELESADDDEIIEIEQQNANIYSSFTDGSAIVVSDSDSDQSNDEDENQHIDVTDDILLSVSSLNDASISLSDTEDVEIVQVDIDEEPAFMDQEVEQLADDIDQESLEILTNENDDYNEIIDLTDDDFVSTTFSPNLFERKLSTDVQQCPICLETLDHLQRTGVNLVITKCHHVMCTLCTRQLLVTSSRCPLCRDSVSSLTLAPYCILT